MKKLICFIVLTFLSTFAFAGIGTETIEQFLTETNQATKVSYSTGVVSGALGNYMVVARRLNFPSERIDACADQFDELVTKFTSYDQVVSTIVMYHIKNGGDMTNLVALIVSDAFFNNEVCMGPKGTGI